jgi:hypothetical protein
MARRLIPVLLAVFLVLGTISIGGNLGTARADLQYVSDTSTLVALSTDGVNYGSFRNAVACWVHPWWVNLPGATWISSAYLVEENFGNSWR